MPPRLALLILFLEAARLAAARRVTAGSGGPIGHPVVFSGLQPGDMVAFQKNGCDGVTSSSIFSENRTTTHTVAAESSNVTVRLRSDLSEGLYHVCHSPSAGNFVKVGIMELTVEPPPSFTPAGGSVHRNTTVRFGGRAQPGDFVAFAANCSTVTSADRTILPTNLSHNYRGDLLGALRICFATAETGGDAAADFADIGSFKIVEARLPYLGMLPQLSSQTVLLSPQPKVSSYPSLM